MVALRQFASCSSVMSARTAVAYIEDGSRPKRGIAWPSLQRLEGRAPMPERDGYIPGVPCWVDASEPDPEAAVDFYGALFGWEFQEVMPPGSEGRYFIARREATGWSLFDQSGDVRGGDVAAVGSTPGAAPTTAMWNTYFWVESADDATSKVRDAGGRVVMEPFD